MDSPLSFSAALLDWQRVRALNARRATVVYHGELMKIIRTHWPAALDLPPEAFSMETVCSFVERVAHYSPARFNGLVSIVRPLVPAAAFLKRRTVRPKIVILPDAAGYRAVLAELDRAHRGHAGLIVRLLALTGLRIGEARALAWCDVLPEGLLVRDSKTHAARLVPYVGECREVLSRLQRVTGDGERLLPCASVKAALRCACGRAGVALLTHHDFRRLFATRCIESGVDLPTASRWLGHKDGGALLGKTYFHLLTAHQRAMAAMVRV